MTVPNERTFATAELTEAGLSIELPKTLPSGLEDMVVNMVPGAPSLGKVDDDSHLLIQGDLAAEGERWDDQHDRYR